MPPVPKKKSTKARRNKKFANTAFLTGLIKCQACGKLKFPHKVCPACGSYK